MENTFVPQSNQMKSFYIQLALTSRYGLNVIKIDCSKLTKWNLFKASDKNLEFAALYVRDGLLQLASALGLEICQFILSLKFLGHSLGAHLAGYVAELLTQAAGDEQCKVSLIVAMDAAGWMFSPIDDKRHCLKPHFALKVIVFHSSIEKIPSKIPPKIKMGTDFMLGHEDYFLNGGRLFRKAFDMYISMVMSHMRATNIVLHLIEGAILHGFHHHDPVHKLNLHEELNKKSLIAEPTTRRSAVRLRVPLYVKVEVAQNDNFGLPMKTVSEVPSYKKNTIQHTNKKNQPETWYQIEKFCSKQGDPDCSEEE